MRPNFDVMEIAGDSSKKCFYLLATEQNTRDTKSRMNRFAPRAC